MMVVKGTVPTNTFGTHAASVEFMLPADNCVWSQVASGNGYEIAGASYILNGAAIAISNPALGVIGKSGRFVQITM
jgi:hypothetical protein